MAATVTKLYGPVGHGGRWESVYNVAGDASYPTGGWPITKNQLGVHTNDTSSVVTVGNHGLGYVIVHDAANNKLLAYRQTAATGALVEVPNATDISAATAKIILRVSYSLGI